LPDRSSAPPRPLEPEPARRGRRPWALWLLLVPVALVVYPPLYSRVDPTLAGVPFFVWYQIAAVIAGGVVTGVVYLLRGGEQDDGE
jgi:hypothetical protein